MVDGRSSPGHLVLPRWLSCCKHSRQAVVETLAIEIESRIALSAHSLGAARSCELRMARSRSSPPRKHS